MLGPSAKSVRTKRSSAIIGVQHASPDHTVRHVRKMYHSVNTAESASMHAAPIMYVVIRIKKKRFELSHFIFIKILRKRRESTLPFLLNTLSKIEQGDILVLSPFSLFDRDHFHFSISHY